MKYQIIIGIHAKQELKQAKDWLEKQAPDEARRWEKEILAVIRSLRQFPKRGPLASEGEYFPKKAIRQLLFGKRRRQYRILFTISDDTVHILHVSHTSRRPKNR